MENKLLKDYSDLEKGAYLGAISSLATADHSASEDEIAYILALADSAGLNEKQKDAVAKAAIELTGDELKKCLDILKDSDLRFSLVTDLISFSKTDKNFSAEEITSVEKISQYLGINAQQFNLLDQFVNKTVETKPEAEEITKPGFLSKLGLDDKFKSSGINMSSLVKGLLGIAGPIILANMFRNKFSKGNPTNPLNVSGGGGLNSIISMLSGGRGFSKTGNFFTRLLGA